MDGLIGLGVVPFGQGDIAPAAPKANEAGPGEATDGSLSGTPASRTRLPAWWITMMIREMRAVVIAGGITPNARVFTQVRDAIRNMIAAATVPRVPKRAAYLASGTWTCPGGVSWVKAQVAGAGGAGGGCVAGTRSGGGGGAGGYAEAWVPVVPGTVYSVTVGLPGGPLLNASGLEGASSAFGSYVSATGGQGGASGVPDSHGGAGGAGSIAASVIGFGIPGGFGTDGSGASSDVTGGAGGASFFGGGGRGGTIGGIQGQAPGSGGGGGYSTTSPGGRGAAGMVTLEWWEAGNA